MKIGILHEVSPEDGGQYQCVVNAIKCVRLYDKDNKYILFYTDKNLPLNEYQSNGWELVYLEETVVDNIFILRLFRGLLRLFLIPFKISSKFIVGKYSKIKNYNIELLYCPGPSLAGYFCNIPYIITIFDLMQKYHKEFPERNLLIGILRSIRYSIGIKHAKSVVADSEAGKNDIIKFYKTKAEKIQIFPNIPINLLKNINYTENQVKKVMNKYQIPSNYIFYPAQLWYHKNHIGIIKALEIINSKYGIEISAIFSGTKKEAYDDIMKTIKELNMQNQIKYLGYISDDEMVILYKHALAMVMPTFFGPANVPVWEAFALGCPSISSNVHGIQEQIGDAGLLVDPYNFEDIADKIYQVYLDDDLRKEMVKKGLDSVNNPGMEYYTKNLISLFN